MIPDNIKPLKAIYAKQVASIHHDMISTGFLSSLGVNFLTQLYKAIQSCPSGFGFVWVDENDQVLGFIACSENTGKLYKQSLIRRGFLMALPIAKYILRPSFVKRIINTLRYPGKTSEQLPPAEVLSIAVCKEGQGKGIAPQLMEAAFEEFKKRNIQNLKVAVWSENIPANKFYQKSGFTLSQTRKHHGLDMNVYSTSL